jgi:hypothetical protein
MHLIQLKIHKFLQDIQSKPYSIPEDLLVKFGNETRLALKKQFEREPRPFKISMSNAGKPLCMLQYEQQGLKDNMNIIRNLYGDIVEDIVLFLLHASGINVISELQRVSLVYDGIQINGEYDVVLDLGDGLKVWDIKSASEWTFKNKFTDVNFDKFVEEDYFGYVTQLMLYSEGLGIPAGGWIITNKSDGELAIVEVPQSQDEYRRSSIERTKQALKQASKTQGTTNNKSIPREFKSFAETYKRKPTGNYHLVMPCVMCSARWKCWPSLRVVPQESSTAKFPKMMHYVNKEC